MGQREGLFGIFTSSLQVYTVPSISIKMSVRGRHFSLLGNIGRVFFMVLLIQEVFSRRYGDWGRGREVQTKTRKYDLAAKVRLYFFKERNKTSQLLHIRQNIHVYQRRTKLECPYPSGFLVLITKIDAVDTHAF